MIDIEGLFKTYTSGHWFWRQETPVLKDFNFTATPGKITGVLGPNGAGKTTLFRIIAGLEKPTSGKISINGVDPWRNPQAVRGKIALLPEEPGVPRLETGRNHLFEFGTMMGMTPDQIRQHVQKAEDTLQIASFWDRQFSKYSRGQKARIALARMLLMPDASVMIFDEPSNGLDFESVARLHTFIRQMANEGRTILVASHILADLKHLCDRLVGVDGGKTASEETLKAWLDAHEQLRARRDEQTHQATDEERAVE